MATTPQTTLGVPLAGAMLSPASEDELATIVADAAARGQSLACEGNGSKRHHGPAAWDKARRLSLRRLDRVTAYDPGDMVVSVQTGARLVDLQRTLAEHRQWLPIDPPYAGATIGGILATASSGPRRHGYGTIKDALLGMRVVGAAGQITKSGGRVVKNVSGFDLHRLQVGAFGTLGVLLEAHFKVSTRPALMGALLLGFDSFDVALRRVGALAATPLRPVALEAIDAGAAASLRSLSPELPETAGIAIVGIEGSAAVFDRHMRDLAGERAAARVATLLEGGAADRLWQAFRDAPSRAVDDIVLRIGARPQQLPDLLSALRLEGDDLRARGAHAGVGIARVRLARPADAAGVIELGRRVAAWHQQAQQRQGYVVVEAAPLGMPGREGLSWGVPAGQDLCRKIKEAWDPTSILNPGRLAL